MLGHVGGTAGEGDPGSGPAATVTSSTGGRGQSSATTCLVGKAPKESRQLYLSVAVDGLGDVLATWCEVAVAPAY
jgi:hypothetical protein